MKPINDDTYELSTGRTFYANNGIIGICSDTAEEGRRQLAHGYDGGIDTDLGSMLGLAEGDWTVAERRELADYMIGLWALWRDKQE